MKKITELLSIRTRIALLLFIGVITFASCNKKDATDYIPQPASGLMAFNLATDRSAVVFTIGGNLLTNSALGYTNYTGAYLPVYPGNRTVEAYNANTNSVIASNGITFQDQKYYSVFLVGKDSSYTNVLVEDNLDSLAAETGKAYIRYINAIPNSASVDLKVSSAGAATVSDTASFKKVTAFRSVPAGEIVLAATNETSTINTTRTLTVEASKVYTILLVGDATSTDPLKAPQLKFILNGTITP